jgi:toxin FitB
VKAGPIVVDSSVWIEIFAGGLLATSALAAVSAASQVAVPTLVLFEVYKKLRKSSSESEALLAMAAISQYRLLDLNRQVALTAADIAQGEDLAMADSIVLAHARATASTLLTLDHDFANIRDARVLRN